MANEKNLKKAKQHNSKAEKMRRVMGEKADLPTDSIIERNARYSRF